MCFSPKFKIKQNKNIQTIEEKLWFQMPQKDIFNKNFFLNLKNN